MKLKEKYIVETIEINGELTMIFPEDIVKAFGITKYSKILIKPNLENKII